MAFLRAKTVGRIFTKAILESSTLQQTKNSSSTATNALRAFYLSVHPDFFAQFPKIQKINESSLKRLNHYLDAVQCTRQVKSLQPTRVEFYFRNQNKDPAHGDFKLVRFTLQSHDLVTNLEHILSSCGLPATHLKDMTIEGTNSKNIDTRYRYTPPHDKGGFDHAQYDEHEIQDSSLSLKNWLNKNATECRERQESSRLIRQSNESLKEDICMELGLREIDWCSPWQHEGEQGTLRNFARFSSKHYEKLHCLRGRRLVFTDRTMAGADESICIDVENVTQQWLKFLASFDEKFNRAYAEARHLDNYVHAKFGNIKVIRPKVRLTHSREHCLVSIDQYLLILSKIITRLKTFESEKGWEVLPWSMRNLEMIFVSEHDSRFAGQNCFFSAFKQQFITVACSREPVHLLPNGRFRVQENCKADELVQYVVSNKSLAEEKQYINASDRARSHHLCQLCKEKLGIASISKEFTIQFPQLSKFCENLLLNVAVLSPLLKDLDIRVTSKYFSVFDNGQSCIPWNWRM